MTTDRPSRGLSSPQGAPQAPQVSDVHPPAPGAVDARTAPPAPSAFDPRTDMPEHTTPTDQTLTVEQLDEIELRANGYANGHAHFPPLCGHACDMATAVPRLVAEVRRLRAESADLQGENAKLLRWHREDCAEMDRQRATIVRLRVELATAQAASA